MTDYACIAEDLASHGLIVISIQSQLETDHSPKFWSKRSISKYACVIDNMLYVFEWLKINKFIIFANKININKVGLIGHSMGGNALFILANKTSSTFQKKIDTLLPHETNQKNIKECIIFMDGAFNYPREVKYPILFCLSEESQHYQEQSGLLEDLNKIGYEVRHYKGSRHISFMDHGFINLPITHNPDEKYFNGTKEECMKFWDLLRDDIRGFLQKNGIF